MQRHSFSTYEWISLRNSPFFVAENLWLQWGCGLGGTWTSNLMTNALPFEVWTIKTRCFLPHVFNTGSGEKDIQGICLWCNIKKMIPVHWQRHFIFDRLMDVLREIVSFLWQKMSHFRGISTQNLSIHAESPAIWSGSWHVLLPDGIKSVQNTMSQRSGFVIL